MMGPGTPVTRASVFVQSIHLRNFRGIESFTIDFEPSVTVLVGPNNVGKSRILRAIDLACGGATADRDDLTVGGPGEALITVVLAPSSGNVFGDAETRLLGAGLQLTPDGDRFAWRAAISSVGTGGIAMESRVLLWDSSANEWSFTERAQRLTADQARVTRTVAIGTSRDLAEEIGRRGSTARRLLDHLEFDPATQETIEADLRSLTATISESSPTLQAMRSALAEVEGLTTSGSAQVNVLPSTANELARTASIGFGTQETHLPMRFHGSGIRSLASLQVQRVSFEAMPGEDAGTLVGVPISLIEEPEAHLHPQVQLDLPNLLSSIPGQVIVSTHSAHLATEAPIESIRILKATERTITVRTLKVGQSGNQRLNNPSTFPSEIEKIRRLVERPFGELLFAAVIVIGDGATERAFLPPLIRAALGSRGAGVCVVDPGSMSNSGPLLKFADAIGTPWLLFSDHDEAGKKDASACDPGLLKTTFVGDPGEGFEAAICRYNQQMADDICAELQIERLSKDKSGVTGRRIAHRIIDTFPVSDMTLWPICVQALLSKIQPHLAG